MMIREMGTLAIKKAQINDLPQILEIYAYARNFMKENGNASQWKDDFPPKDLLIDDIKAGNLYVIGNGDAIHAVFAFLIGAEPSYSLIEQGEWLSDAEYGTLHRVAADGTVHGMFDRMVAFCSQKIGHLRIDTHQDNKVMQHLICKNGFQECGIIYVADGSPRIAYEKGF